jgi:hypothetical protein
MWMRRLGPEGDRRVWAHLGRLRAVKRAGPDALNRLEWLLSALRELPRLREKSRGTFYRGSRAFLHFHEDPAGLFADVLLDAEFERLDVSNTKDQDRCCKQYVAPSGRRRSARAIGCHYSP